MSVPRPVLIAMSILAGIKVFVSAAVVADLIGLTVTGVILAGLAAVDIGVAMYLQGQVVPLKTTVAYLDPPSNRVRAGGAAIARTGAVLSDEVPVGELVADRPTDDVP